MNKEAFESVIDAIRVHGQKHFNMSTFIGMVEPLHADYIGKHHLDVYDASPIFDRPEKVGDNIFKCNTVMCIAGFAAAIKNNYKATEWMLTIGGNFHEYAAEACKYLGIPHSVGESIFYTGGHSVWKMVYQHEHDRYPDLELDEDTLWSGGSEYCSCDDDHDETDESCDINLRYKIENYEIEYSNANYFSVDINMKTIKPSYAIDILERIVSGEIVFNHAGMPMYATQGRKDNA